MMKKIVFGSQNQGKVKEFQDILGQKDLTILSWKDFDCTFSVKEDGRTFWENALKKAKITARATNEVSIADDSGLEVDCLNGKPGIFSARYSGIKATDEKNNKKLLEELKGIPSSKRGARFVCAIVVFSPEGRWEWVEGECRGIITEAPRGDQGFGYDPIFFVPEAGKTFAQLNPKEKNLISHRARAISKLRPLLDKYFA